MKTFQPRLLMMINSHIEFAFYQKHQNHFLAETKS